MNFVQKLQNNKIFVWITIAYFLLRFINLSGFPLYNDEAVYLEWAWRMTDNIDHLFYSIHDAKTPLLFWFWGTMEHIFADPILGGRLVNVFTGYIGAVGLYKIGKVFFNQRIGHIAFALYSIIPIFAFFDRQVLFESGYAAAGIWALYYLLRYHKNYDYKSAAMAGVCLALAFMIKISSLIFIIAAIGVFAYIFINSKDKRDVFAGAVITVMTVIVINLVILVQPEFWSTIYDSSNTARFMKVDEVSQFPLFHWISNAIGNSEIVFVYLTPIVFGLIVWNIYSVLKHKRTKKSHVEVMILIWLGVSLLLQLILLRTPIQRYLVAFLPLLLLLAAERLDFLYSSKRNLAYIVGGSIGVLCMGLSLFQSIDQYHYMRFMSHVTRFSDVENYLDGITSGYGTQEPVDFLSHQINDEPAVVAMAVRSGTPEDVFNVVFRKYPNVKAAYLDTSILQIDQSKLDCIKFDVPVFFVSRSQELVGLDKYLDQVKMFPNKYNKNVIGIYEIKKHCEGTTLNLKAIRQE